MVKIKYQKTAFTGFDNRKAPENKFRSIINKANKNML
jgi:hypothetical protein